MDPIANSPLNGSFNGPLPANIVQLRKHFERLHATGGDTAVRPTLCGALKHASPSQASTSRSPVPPPAPTPAPRSEKHSDPATRQYFDHSMGTRINTDALITRSLSDEYPNLSLTVVPVPMLTGDAFDLLSFAAQGNASVIPLEDNSSLPNSLEWTFYVPPFRRLNGSVGFIAEQMLYGRFLYKWEGHEFILYFVDGRDGTDPWGASRNWYILTPQRHNADALVRTVSAWCSEVRNEILVFDGGWWQRSAELWDSVQSARWENVILDESMKEALINDHLSFFNSHDTYEKLRVPWKRGIIYHGPPGNGKTITIKATMRMLQSLDPYVPTLYVRSLDSWSGPSFAISQIFNKAREFAPCYLVLEDIDTIITDEVRSYFLNEVDGLKSNDGIFIIASTNHLDRLDPGIAKRPSRFDRKYLFPDPNVDQREAYCRFWQAKLKSNKEIEFPDRLCRAIAEITDKFSFAYIQEAFVAALLALARRGTGAGERRTSGASADAWVVVSDDAGDGLDKLVLWVEIQKQIEILREGINDGNGDKQ
ncbi:hypothetical protein D7B24_004474 [Verticillium nonalfalfae]|uniref:ATPase AAA-type core domain-containing protein n=1 Tax=Verticillium nonalfalfae TaxID=1051616 RepID=A0A3M9YDH3_9PEZI|nr:uncharacterized protein D7B24_004474 [Verticillium nonalfalfae]RNJ58603.1 hypothetical protein D7B24_004474 [Verticillium nonalfalfae]